MYHLGQAEDEAAKLQEQIEETEAAADATRRELSAELDTVRAQADHRARSLSRRLAEADAIADVERKKCAAAQRAADELAERNRALLVRLAEADADAQEARDSEVMARRNVVRLRGAVQDLETRAVTATPHNEMLVVTQRQGALDTPDSLGHHQWTRACRPTR
jgi:chromosome segregation ATPase